MTDAELIETLGLECSFTAYRDICTRHGAGLQRVTDPAIRQPQMCWAGIEAVRAARAAIDFACDGIMFAIGSNYEAVTKGTASVALDLIEGWGK